MAKTKKKPQAYKPTPVQLKLQAIVDELGVEFIEREEVIRGLVAAMIAEKHALLLGPPGTAKSMLVNRLCSRITDANYFPLLITKTTTPEEVFGPLMLSQLENDVYKRKTDGYLPTAHVSFLDECWKGSSAILNTLLTLMNERKFDNDGRHDCPLKMCVGASNELPEDNGLAALFDRFLVRFWITGLKGRRSRLRLLNLNGFSQTPTTITLSELDQAIDEREKVTLSDPVKNRLLEVWDAVEGEGAIASDRRWRQCLPLLQAVAYVAGRNRVHAADLNFLSNVLWEDPKEAGKLRSVIKAAADPIGAKATAVVDAAEERANAVPEPDKSNKSDVYRKGEEAQHALKAATDDLVKLRSQALEDEVAAVDDAEARIHALKKIVESRLVTAVVGEKKAKALTSGD